MTFDLSPDGTLSERGRRAIRAHLKQRAVAAGMDEGDTTPVRVRLSHKVRSGKANSLLWLCYERIVAHYAVGGQNFTTGGLHSEFKEKLLPVVAGAVMEATGETVEYEIREARPDGRETVRLTSTGLSPLAFSVFIQLVDREAAAIGCDLSDLLDREDPASFRSGRVEDRGTEEVEYTTPEPGVYVLAEPRAEAGSQAAAYGLSQEEIADLFATGR